jgi:signal transduction histidine kinase
VTRRSLAVDAALAALVLGLSLAMLAGGGFGDRTPGARALDAPGVLLAMVSALPLVARRVAPLGAYAVMATASLALDGLNYPFDVPFGPVVAVYALAVAYSGEPRPARRRAAMLAVAAFVPATATAYAVSGHQLGGIVPELLFWAVSFGGLWIAGDRTRLRRERMAELEERARHTQRDAERERRLAAAEERTRIARELHDSAGHSINVILVQASAARLLRERDPEGSRRAIATIEQVARGTIGEIDRLVRALRDGDSAQPPPPADPAALEELVDSHRASGLTIATAVRGERRALPRSVAWAAHRILQEALTNAARHGCGTADVAVSFEPGAVDITVTNPTAAARPPPDTGGHGIVGMRERVTLLGGTLEAEAGAGSYRLHARLPHEAAS